MSPSTQASPALSESPLVSAPALFTRLSDPELVLVDCRFALKEPELGYERFVTGHLPGAVYAHLERDLSGPIVAGKTGRHPLPEPELLAQKLSTWGIGSGSWVVAYDQSDGSMAAARLWWLLRYLGHGRVSVFDGGLDGWTRHNLPLESGSAHERPPRALAVQLQPHLVATRADVSAASQARPGSLLDVRAPERYSGSFEPIDARAGHIPGAHNLPFASLTEHGAFLQPSQLRERLRVGLHDVEPERAIFYCGSGVTACHAVLAAAAAGCELPRLYAGSFSEWIVDPEASVTVGEEP